MTKSPEPFAREVLLSVHRHYDVDIRVSTVEIEDQKYVDVREFIPSLQQYGRGIVIPLRSAAEVGAVIASQGTEEKSDVDAADLDE